MKLLNHLFAQNRTWAEKIKAEDPRFFEKLSAQQAPEYLWIGCSDSRVTANDVLESHMTEHLSDIEVDILKNLLDKVIDNIV